MIITEGRLTNGTYSSNVVRCKREGVYVLVNYTAYQPTYLSIYLRTYMAPPLHLRHQPSAIVTDLALVLVLDQALAIHLSTYLRTYRAPPRHPRHQPSTTLTDLALVLVLD